MTPNEIRELLTLVTFPGYMWHLEDNGRFWLQARFYAPCNKTGAPQIQYTRKWYISAVATKSEVVQTALKCVLTSVEHEAREQFKYRGRRIFAPHCSVDTLWELCTEDGVGADGREEEVRYFGSFQPVAVYPEQRLNPDWEEGPRG